MSRAKPEKEKNSNKYFHFLFLNLKCFSFLLLQGERLFDANRSTLYQQSCDDVDGWVAALEAQMIQGEEDFGKDLTTVNLQVQKQNVSNQNSLVMIHSKKMYVSVNLMHTLEITI